MKTGNTTQTKDFNQCRETGGHNAVDNEIE